MAVLLALMMALSIGVTAAAANVTDSDGWTYLPTSPDGLEDGDMWIDFRGVFDPDASEEENQALLDYYNSGTWYVKLDEHLVKCENGPENLNRIFTRSQMPFLLCIKEVGVSWVDVRTDCFADIQVGDYYLDKEVFRSVCTEKFTEYYLPQALESYEEHYGEAPTEEQAAEIRANLKTSVEENLVETFWTGYSYSYNPHGTFYRYKLTTLPVPWGYYLVDGFIAKQMMLLVEVLDASLRVADAATVASSSWQRVASSIEEAEEGGYYIDFTDIPAVMAAFGTEQTPTEEDMAIVKRGEWYADFDRGVVTGKISETVEGDAISFWFPESEDLFALLKLKPVSEPEPQVTPEEPATDEPGNTDNGGNTDDGGSRPGRVPFWQRIVDFFNRIINVFRSAFRR